MLINYTFNNYLSFKKETTLSLETGDRLRKYPDNTMSIDITNSKNKINLLKNAIIFGGNGSGKSNLLKSLFLMKKIVSNIPSKTTTKLPKRSFLLDNFSNDKNTSFEIELIQNNTRYKYFFEYNRLQIVNETLEIYNKNKYETYFKRTNCNNYDIVPDHLVNFINETRDNVLFLQTAQGKNDSVSIDIIKWFEESLVFFSKKASEELFYLLKNSDNKKKFLEFMFLADMNMVDIEVESSTNKISEEVIAALTGLMTTLNDGQFNESIPEEQIIETLYTVYKKYDENGNVIGKQRIPIQNESSGTQKIIYIALNILFCQNEKKVIILDEFDDAFHEELANALVKIFNSKSNTTQFLVTSHELNLMDNKIRKDQIYFVEKDFTGESDLYSIFDFDDSTRGDIGYYKRYMKGAFGAIPNIDSQRLVKMFASDAEV
ncbi:AAA family ATPase [Enterococcus avium]|uniref:AAA family ATPase n=1 Tax=Enterococcus avium TaxID=33945 RepID=UPI002891CD60|nr:ATP-binding protein [Enterococcus avium]MDT2485473.1 ATP-binding protein [Enterococcus avium]MDT2512136.1 ATP-binding protein [Enterococcus avium]